MGDEASEPAVVEPGPTATSPRVVRAEKTAPVESRTRKKVTFDLDLRVRTIPNRIPIYERRPAASASYPGRPHPPLAFVPRPLDLRGRDRYLLGATTTRRIIDLFGLPSGFPSYPTPPTSAGAKKPQRPSGAPASAPATAANPYCTFANFRTTKISRAAMNLKQITAALGEHFDSSVYKEWDSSKRVQGSLPASPRHGARSASSIASELGVAQPRRSGGHGNAIAAFSPSRLRAGRHPAQSPKPNLSPTPSRGHHASYGAGAHPSEVPSSPSESWDRQRLPSVTSEQMSFNSRSQAPRKRSAASDAPSYRHRRGGSPADSSPVETGAVEAQPTAPRDRPPSRCSTIETFVISDILGAKPSPSPAGCLLPGSGPRGAGPSLGHRRVIVGPNSRPIAWETGIPVPITEPVLDISAIRTTPTVQDGGNPVQWQVTSRPPNLST